MAGGNLSPRQKMINMMYLVLTALLALNVSAEILEAFNSLRISLKETSDKSGEKNKDTKEAIEAKIDEEIGQGNRKNEGLKQATADVTKKTDEVINFINTQIAEMFKIAEYDEATGEIPNNKETEANYAYWMAHNDEANGGRGDGPAKKLREELNGYMDWAVKFLAQYGDSSGKTAKEFNFTDDKGEVIGLAIDPKDDPNVSPTSNHKEDTWEYHTFHGKPVIADLAMLEKFKGDVQNVEYELLSFIKGKLGAVTFKIDSLIAMSAPNSRVVAAGMKFETKLFVTMASKDIKPEFSGSGSIAVEPGGTSAMMTLQAPGGFAAGTYEKKVSYSAKIKVPKADGGVEELTLNDEFTVRKPEVVITSASVQNLYYGCGNALNVDCPALGEFYNPVFSATDADVIPDPSVKKKVVIVPRGKTCDLTVASNTNGQRIEIDKVKYKVIMPPRPSIQLLISGSEYNGAAPINKKATCTVKLKPDSDFAAALPKDCRYAISKVELLSQRSLGAPTTVDSYNGSGKDATKGITVDLGNSLKQDPPGTKIYFKIDKIYRINFQNKQMEEKFGERELYIGAVIK